jgi:hypothetical protein
LAHSANGGGVLHRRTPKFHDDGFKSATRWFPAGFRLIAHVFHLSPSPLGLFPWSCWLTSLRQTKDRTNKKPTCQFLLAVGLVGC